MKYSRSEAILDEKKNESISLYQQNSLSNALIISIIRETSVGTPARLHVGVSLNNITLQSDDFSDVFRTRIKT